MYLMILTIKWKSLFSDVFDVLGKFKKQQEKCQSTLSSIAAASSRAKPVQKPLHAVSHPMSDLLLHPSSFQMILRGFSM